MTYLERTPQFESGKTPHENALHAQASELLTSRHVPAKDSSEKENATGEHRVRKNESLYSVARDSLIANGGNPVSQKAIMAEVARIVALNCERYKDLNANPNAIREGWTLKLKDAPTGANNAKDAPQQKRPSHERTDGYRIVGQGESLHSIAREQLASKGQKHITHSAVESEIDRLVAINKDRYPSLEKHKEHIELGWKLKVEDSWKEAEPRKVTLVKKGEKVIGSESAWLVIESGGHAILNAGAKGFLAEGGTIEKAMPGSMVIADGGVIEDYGATLLARNPKVKIHQHKNEAAE